METKQQRKQRLMLMRKKYGLGEFKKNKRKSPQSQISSKKITRRVSNMARKKRSSRSFGNKFSAYKSFVGAGAYLGYEIFLSPMIPLESNTKTLVELVAGLYFSNRKGVIGDFAKTMAIINSYKLLNTYVAPMISGQTA